MLQKFVLGLSLFLTTLTAHADNVCIHKAIRVAREHIQSKNVSLVSSVQKLDSKDYIEAYYIVLKSARPGSNEIQAITVAMMKSDCSVVSVIPELGEN